MEPPPPTTSVGQLQPETAQLRQLRAAQPHSPLLLEPPQRLCTGQPELPLAQLPEHTLAESKVAAPARAAAGALTAALVEAIAGRRPTQQLDGWVSTDVLELVERLSRTHRDTELRLRSIRVQAPRAEVVEVSAHLTQAGRSRAAAIQLSCRGGQWRATGLAIALQTEGIVQVAGAA